MTKRQKSDYIEARNVELWRAAMDALGKLGRNDSVVSIYQTAVETPCSRLWIAPETAAKVVSSILHKRRSLSSLSRTKREMAKYIIGKLGEHHGKCLFQAVEDIVYSPAPRFFMLASSAMTILYAYRRRRWAMWTKKTDDR